MQMQLLKDNKLYNKTNEPTHKPGSVDILFFQENEQV
jgi:hypothetical protein